MITSGPGHLFSKHVLTQDRKIQFGGNVRMLHYCDLMSLEG